MARMWVWLKSIVHEGMNHISNVEVHLKTRSGNVNIMYKLPLRVLLVFIGVAIALFCLFCCFTSQATAMVMAGLSIHLTTLFPGQTKQAVNQYFVHILSLVTDNKPS